MYIDIRLQSGISASSSLNAKYVVEYLKRIAGNLISNLPRERYPWPTELTWTATPVERLTGFDLHFRRPHAGAIVVDVYKQRHDELRQRLVYMDDSTHGTTAHYIFYWRVPFTINLIQSIFLPQSTNMQAREHVHAFLKASDIM